MKHFKYTPENVNFQLIEGFSFTTVNYPLIPAYDKRARFVDERAVDVMLIFSKVLNMLYPSILVSKQGSYGLDWLKTGG